MYSLVEKREYIRIELEKRKYKEIDTPCIARFQVKQYEGEEISAPEWNIVALKNLSAGGMLFNHHEQLKIDSILDVKIDISETTPTINCVGRIVRIEELQGHSGHSTAIEFTEISKQKRELINLTAEKILKKEAKRRNFYFGRLGRMIKAIKRKEIIEDPEQENSTALENRMVKEIRVCDRCKKSVSVKDLAAGLTTERYGQLVCHMCSTIPDQKMDEEIPLNRSSNRKHMTIQQNGMVKGIRVCGRCKKIVPQKDLAAGLTTERYGQLVCHMCSTTPDQKMDEEIPLNRSIRGNTAIQQNGMVKGIRVCWRCKKSVSAKDLAAGLTTERYGQLVCHECSKMVIKKKELGVTAIESIRKNSVSETVTSKIVVPGKVTRDVPVTDENRRLPKSHIERLHDQVRRESVKENTATQQKAIVRENKVCGRCKKSVSARDVTSAAATELYGSLLCLECSHILRKQKDQVITAKDSVRKLLATESLEPETVGVKKDTNDVVAIGVHKLPPENRIDRLPNQTRRFSEKPKVCRVTFRLPKVAAPQAKSVYIVGDFNNWNTHENPMKKQKNGDYAISLDLEPGKNYKFSYLIDSVIVGLISYFVKNGEDINKNAAVCM